MFHPHQQRTRVLISPQPRQLLLFFFLIITILVSIKWGLPVVFMFISLMSNDGEHLFMCLLAICISSPEKCLFEPFAHFLNWIVCLLVAFEQDIPTLLSNHTTSRRQDATQRIAVGVLRRLCPETTHSLGSFCKLVATWP